MKGKFWAFKRNNKLLFLACLTLALLFCLTVFLSFFGRETLAMQISYGVVVIDAGHGGIDGGVSGVNTKVSESEINLAISKKLKAVFEDASFEVVLTRPTSAGLYGSIAPGHKKRDMLAREKIIKQANPMLFISIHQNAYSRPYRRGAQVFYNSQSKSGKDFAFTVQDQLNGLKDNGKICKALCGDFYLLNACSCPAIIVECGFLSNPQDERLLLSTSYQTQLSRAIFYGALNFLSSHAPK